MSISLPTGASLEHLKKQAKSLLRDYRSGDPQALQSVKACFPAASRIGLRRIQKVLARSYDFDSWDEMASYVVRSQGFIPLLHLRGMVCFPGAEGPLFFGTRALIRALEIAWDRKSLVAIVARRLPESSISVPEELFTIGTLASIESLTRLPDGTVKAMVRGRERIRTTDVSIVDFPECQYEELPRLPTDDPHVLTELVNIFTQYGRARIEPQMDFIKKVQQQIDTGKLDPDRRGAAEAEIAYASRTRRFTEGEIEQIIGLGDPWHTVYAIAAKIPGDIEFHQRLLTTDQIEIAADQLTVALSGPIDSR